MFGWQQRKAEQGAKFRCGYCHGRVLPTRARVVRVRGQVQYVHAWHKPGKGE
jgi:hypothetical protein